MAHQTIVVLSDAEQRARPLAHASAVIRWLLGERDSAYIHIGARLTEESTVFTVSGDSQTIETWLAERCEGKWPGPGSRMPVDEHTVLLVKRCVIAPQPAPVPQSRTATSAGADDFSGMLDIVNKMATLTMQGFQ